MTSVVTFPKTQGKELNVQPGLEVMTRPVRFLYSVAEAAELLNLSGQAIYDLINCGDLPKVMTGTAGKTTRIAHSDLIAYIDNHRVVKESDWAVGL